MRHNKQLVPIIKFAKQHGYDVTISRRNQHLRISKAGHRTVFCSSTPSDFRAVRNTLADLRRSQSNTVH